MARVRWLTVAAAITSALVVVAGDVLGLAAAPVEMSWLVVVAQTAAIWMTAAVGLLIGLRRPGHMVGLLLAGTALVLALGVAMEGYGRYAVLAGDHGSLPAGPAAVLWANASWPLVFAGATAIALVFPDGKLPSRRWLSAAWVAAISITGVLLLSLFSPEPFDRPFHGVANPLPARPDVLAPLEVLFLAGMVGSLVAGVLATRSRYRSSLGRERQQILWLASSAWLIPLTLVVCIIDLAVPGELDLLVLGLVLTTALAVPASIGIAILVWHLYDLDRVVNRALVYGVLTGCVVAIYALVILGPGLVVRDRSFAVTLVATAAVALAVNPLRLVLQRAVDRFMYGDRRDPTAGLTRLAERLENTLAPQTALRTIVDTVAESLKVSFVAVDLVRSGRVERMATHGSPGGRDPLTVPLVFQGEPVGQLVVESRGANEPLNAADRRLLDQLVRHAGPVVHAIRLTADLQRSRERLVRAQEEERRRIRRDLHDGLGPVLATAVFQVDDARDITATDPARADEQLAALRTTLQEAVADIRRLVYALRPPALDELGLASALAEEVARFNAHGSGPRITLDSPEALPVLPAAIEVAAYRIALEAVTNAVRHSGAGACSVTLGVNGGLELEILDDGVGLTKESRGSGVGLASMSERANELGGALRVEHRRGGGTLVHATLPLELP